MKESETPMRMVNIVNGWASRVFQELDQLAELKKNGEKNWPDYCPIPLRFSAPILTEKIFLTKNLSLKEMDEFSRLSAVKMMTACWAWKQNKIVYQFDRDLAQVLFEQAKEMQEEDTLPVETLIHLPYPCIYVKNPIKLGDEPIDGFFSWIDYDTEGKCAVMHFLSVYDDMRNVSDCCTRLMPGKTIRDCAIDTMSSIDGKINTSGNGFKEQEILESWYFQFQAIQLILYLVSTNAEVESGPPPELDNPQKAKRGKKKKSSVRVKNVGVKIGAAIRKAKAKAVTESTNTTGHGSRKSPHSRRGHWHHYWVGPRDGKRELILKWIAPTFVNLNNGIEDRVVVYPVKK